MDFSERRPVLAVDLGGTKVAAALLTPRGEILERSVEPTCQEGPEPGIRQILRMLRALVERSSLDFSQLAGIGVGIPAVLAPESDHVIWAPNLEGWREVALRPALEEATGLPCAVEYDGHTAVLGEWWQGAGRGWHSIAMLIIGTGIGGGLVLDGRLYRGRDRLAGAAGWFAMTSDAGLVDDRGHSLGHWEALAAGPGIARRALGLLPEYPESSLHQETEVTARQIFAAAREGDPLSLRVVDETAGLIGLGAANLISLVNPEIVILGGSIGCQPELLPRVQEVVRRWAQPVSARSARLQAAQLGSEAGLFGAACALLDRQRQPDFKNDPKGLESL